jgi:hypothetical protein
MSAEIYIKMVASYVNNSYISGLKIKKTKQYCTNRNTEQHKNYKMTPEP